MSSEATTWVYERSGERGTARHVLLALAWRAGPDAIAWPSVERLAVDADADRRSVQRALRDLEAAGLIERAGKMPSGVIRYRLTFEGGRSDAAPKLERGRRHAAPGAAQATSRGGVTPPELLELQKNKFGRRHAAPAASDRPPLEADLLTEAERTANLERLAALRATIAAVEVRS